MALPGIKSTTILDGSLGIVDQNPTGIQVKMGNCSSGNVNQLYSFSNIQDAKTSLGYGKLLITKKEPKKRKPRSKDDTAPIYRTNVRSEVLEKKIVDVYVPPQPCWTPISVKQALDMHDRGQPQMSGRLADTMSRDSRIQACIHTLVFGILGLPFEWKWVSDEESDGGSLIPAASYKPSEKDLRYLEITKRWFCQSYEQKLMLSIYKLTDKCNDDFFITLYQFDGLSIKFNCNKEEWIKTITNTFNQAALEMGIYTTLAWSFLDEIEQLVEEEVPVIDVAVMQEQAAIYKTELTDYSVYCYFLGLSDECLKEFINRSNKKRIINSSRALLIKGLFY